MFGEAFTYIKALQSVGLLEKVSCTYDSQSSKSERCEVLINIIRRINFHPGAGVSFCTHLMVSVLITQDAFLTPVGLINSLQSGPQVY